MSQPCHPLVPQEDAQEADHLLLPPGQGLQVTGYLLLGQPDQPDRGLAWTQQRQTLRGLIRIMISMWWCNLRLIRTSEKLWKNFWNFKLLTIYLIWVWLPIAEDSSSNVSEAAFSSNIFDEVDVSLRTFWFLKSQVDSFPLKSFSIWSVFEGEIGGKPLLKEKEFI